MPLERTYSPSDSDLDEIADLTGLALSGLYKSIYTDYAGSRFSDDAPAFTVTYPDGTKVNESLNAVLTIDDIKRQWPHVGYLADFAVYFGLSDDFVEPKYLVPIAEVYDGGIYLAVGGRHVDKSFIADNGDFGIALLAVGEDDLRGLIETASCR